MDKPILIEKYTDNGDFSHWALIQKETGKLLWSEAPEEEIQKIQNCNFCGAAKGLKHGYTLDGEPCPICKTA